MKYARLFEIKKKRDSKETSLGISRFITFSQIYFINFIIIFLVVPLRQENDRDYYFKNKSLKSIKSHNNKHEFPNRN